MLRVLCAGGACIDRAYRALFSVSAGTSNPARVHRGFGGVARNVAENLSRLHVPVGLLSVVGEDDGGSALIRHAAESGIDTRFMRCDPSVTTSEYAAFLNPDGDLSAGMSDMSAVEKIQPQDVDAALECAPEIEWLFVDCNVSPDVLRRCIERARDGSVNLAVDAVSETKVRRLPEDLLGVDLLVLNRSEASALGCESAQAVRRRGAAAVILTLGRDGALVQAEQAVTIPAVPSTCSDVTGAGDALVAGTLYRLLEGDGLANAAAWGSLCAALTVESAQSVRPDLSPEFLAANRSRLESAWTPS